MQQIRKAFPFDSAPRHLIFDRDSIFSNEVVGAVKAIVAKPVRTSFRAPWQSGTAERWVGCCRQELLDHVVVLNQAHLRRLLQHHDLAEGAARPDRRGSSCRYRRFRRGCRCDPGYPEPSHRGKFTTR